MKRGYAEHKQIVAKKCRHCGRFNKYDLNIIQIEKEAMQVLLHRGNEFIQHLIEDFGVIEDEENGVNLPHRV